MATNLPIENLRLDGGTQPRAEIDQAVVDEYRERLEAGDVFPPVVAFHDGKDYWLADGFHRLYAHRAIEQATIRVEVRQGTQRDAILYSVGANASHGQRRTNADKRRAVMCLLSDGEWGGKSSNWIAEQCGVSESLVRSIREESTSFKTKSREGKDGRTIDTSNIGRTRTLASEIGADDDKPKREAAVAVVDRDSGELLDNVDVVRNTTTTAKASTARDGLAAYPDILKCVKGFEKLAAGPDYQFSLIEFRRLVIALRAALVDAL